MCLLLESIKIANKLPQNIELHNARFNRSRNQLFGITNILDLRDIIKIPDNLTNDVYKCRVIFNENIQKIEFSIYLPKIINSLKIVRGDNIEYEHKFLNRTAIENLKTNCGADDILIIKNNQITDTSFANVAFYDGKSWVTPAQPLLKGTKRQLLLEAGIIREEEITLQDLKRFRKLILINAMLEFDERNCIPIENILQ